MADAFYNAGLNGLLAGEIDMDTATIKAILLRGYTYAATHKFLSDVSAVTGTELVATTAALATKTIGTVGVGVFDAADTVWSAVPTGTACPAFILVQTSAVTGGADVAATAQRVIAYLDSYTGLPVTPNGADINLVFPTTANGIFKI